MHLPIPTRLTVHRAALSTALAVVGACGPDPRVDLGASEPPETAGEPGAGVIRLIDRLSDAHLEIPPPPPLRDGASRRVHSLGDGFPCPARDGVFRCEAGGARTGPAQVYAVADALPQRAYRWQREMRVTSTPCLTLQVAQSSRRPDELEAGGELHAGFDVVRTLPQPPAGEWHRDEGWIRTGLDTRSLVFATTTDARCTAELRRFDVEAMPAGAWARATWPDREDPTSLVREGFLLEGHDARTVPDDTGRRALWLPASASASFDLRIPDGAALHLELAPARAARLGTVVTLRVTIRPEGGQPELLLRRTVTPGPRGEGYVFEPLRADLARYAGRAVTLAFAVEATREDAAALVARPRVVVPRRPSDPPNVIVIGIDTLRGDHVPCDTELPAFRRLASEGVCMSAAWAPSTWTVPSFTSIFTAQSPSSHGVLSYEDVLAPGTETLAARLGAAGWTTAALVYKTPIRRTGLSWGFDEWISPPWDRGVTGDEGLALALAWLERHRDERFFLFLHLNDPHQPFNQPPGFRPPEAETWRTERGLPWPMPRIQHVSCDGCRAADGAPSETLARHTRALYAAEVEYTDDVVGRFLDALDAHGLYDDALIVVVSDHGEALFARDHFFGHGNERYDLEVLHVPWIVKPPGGRAPRVVDAPVSAIELAPTVLELAGLDSPQMAGRRGLGDVASGDAEPPPDAVLVDDGIGFDFAVRQGPLARIHGPPTWGLYDLAEDSDATRDLSDERPGRDRALTDVAIRELLAHRSGRYLRVEAARPLREVRVEAPPESLLERWHGPRFDPEPGRSPRLAPGERLLFRLRCGDDEVRVRWQDEAGASHEEVVEFAPFDAERLVGEDAPTVVGVRSRCADAASHRAPSIDAQTLEQLRAQGYIE